MAKKKLKHTSKQSLSVLFISNTEDLQTCFQLAIKEHEQLLHRLTKHDCKNIYH